MPMETFSGVRRNDEARFGEYRTKRVNLEMYGAMPRTTETGRPYVGLIPSPSGLATAESG